MSEATRRPWKWSDRNWRNEVDEHNRYITGDHNDHCVAVDPETGEDVDDGASCVGVAIVLGNATSGDVADVNAALICRAVNSFDALVAACKALLFCAADLETLPGEGAIKNARAALRLAEEGGGR